MFRDGKYYCEYCGKEIINRALKDLKKRKHHFCNRQHFHLSKMNKISYESDYVVLEVRYIDKKEKCLVDIDDYENKIKSLGTKIFMYENGYCYFCVQKNGQNKKIKLHRYLMDVVDKEDIVIDHINRNPLDNRKSNLRKCNTVLNTYNKDYNSNSTSNVKGVSFNKAMQKWRGQVQVNGIRIYTNPYKSFEECCKVTEDLRKQMYEEYRKTLDDKLKENW